MLIEGSLFYVEVSLSEHMEAARRRRLYKSATLLALVYKENKYYFLWPRGAHSTWLGHSKLALRSCN